MSLVKAIDSNLLGGAYHISRVLNQHQFTAYFAGGAVRDLLLGKRVSEIDIATSASPHKIEELFPRTLGVGKQFGVVIVVIDSTQYEVSTFREDSDYQNGRHPRAVRFTDARRDTFRRDFTVNALFLHPFTEQVIDYVKGREDLKNRIIRTVGEPAERFKEDKLRVLRGIRFACQLGFKIEEATYRQIKIHARQVLQVSWERIRDEVLNILTGADPARGLDLLFDSGNLREILSEIAVMRGVAQPPEFHPEGDVFEHTRLMFKLSQDLTSTLALGILLHDVGKPPTFAIKDRIRFDGHVELGAKMARDICQRLRISGEETEQVVDLILHHLRFIHVQEMRESKLKRFLRKKNIQEHLELHRLDCLASHGDLSSYDFCKNKLEELSRDELQPKPLIDGHDLIALDLQPGPLFSQILGALEDLQLEGKLVSKAEALTWVKQHFVDNPAD